VDHAPKENAELAVEIWTGAVFVFVAASVDGRSLTTIVQVLCLHAPKFANNRLNLTIPLRIVAVKNSTNRSPARSPAFVMGVGSVANPDRATA
jgi:hypothetical protein